MKSKEEFKIFVKSHPELISYVKSNDMTWQKFYELYSLYDEDDNAWSPYLKNKINIVEEKSHFTSKLKDIPGVGDMYRMVKNIKPEVLQQNINSIQKFLGFISDLVGESGTDNNRQRNIYTPRPTHRMFED